MIRVRNGPEYVSERLRQWASDGSIVLQYIQPGKLDQNAYIERNYWIMRHEWLDRFLFATIEEVQDYATAWLWTYNNDRPNLALGGITPTQKLKLLGDAWVLRSNPIKNGALPDSIVMPALAFDGNLGLTE